MSGQADIKVKILSAETTSIMAYTENSGSTYTTPPTAGNKQSGNVHYFEIFMEDPYFYRHPTARTLQMSNGAGQ